MIARKHLIGLPLAALVLSGWTTAPAEATREAIAAICGAELKPAEATGPSRLAIEPGMGDGGFTIGTHSANAQAWFNYGIKLFHAFYHNDNRVAFDKSVAADPDCALCLWGQALSRGPTQNFDISVDQTRAALEIARKARAAARTPLEIALTDAMVERFTAPEPTAAAPEDAFAAAVLKAAQSEPDNTDLPLIAGEALLTAWRRGDKDGAQRAMAIIEPILRLHPDNTAAIHYYIHATEFAGVPEKALPYARKLARLAPGASHLVHMAAHTYFDVGLYEDAATVNADALKVDSDHLAATNKPGLPGAAYYYGHDLKFGMAGAVMAGDGPLAVRFADDLHRAYPEASFAGNGLGSTEGMRFVILGRYAPDRMLAIADPGDGHADARVYYHYGRGEAFAARRDIAGLTRESAAITGAGLIARLAGGVLKGRLAMLEGRWDDAVAAFGAAAAAQEPMLLTQKDPPSWWYPIHRSVAAAQLKAGRYQMAADEARKSLAAWPADPLALLVLSKAEEGLKQNGPARRDLREAQRDWQGDLNAMAVEGI